MEKKPRNTKETRTEHIWSEDISIRFPGDDAAVLPPAPIPRHPLLFMEILSFRNSKVDASGFSCGLKAWPFAETRAPPCSFAEVRRGEEVKRTMSETYSMGLNGAMFLVTD